jgi:hypothetical protein
VRKVSTFAAGVTLGAGAVYFLDPEMGRRRRALFRDRLQRLARRARQDLDIAARDLSNRARGAIAKLEAYIAHDGNAPDGLLVARVRSRLGRVVSHPRSIAVEAHDGRIVLSGPVLSDEEGDLLASVWRVPGVKDVESHLDVHDEAGDVPGLQGSAVPRGVGFLEGHWPPAWQLLAGVAGACLVATGWPGIAGRFFSRLFGVLLLGRAIVNPYVGQGGRHQEQSRGRSRVELDSMSST